MPVIVFLIAIYIGYNLLKELLEKKQPPISQEEMDRYLGRTPTKEQIEAGKIVDDILNGRR